MSSLGICAAADSSAFLLFRAAPFRPSVLLAAICPERTVGDSHPAFASAKSRYFPVFDQRVETARRNIVKCPVKILHRYSHESLPFGPDCLKRTLLFTKTKGLRHQSQPLCLCVMARSERFELPTYGFVVRCSIQLSYKRSSQLLRRRYLLPSTVDVKKNNAGNLPNSNAVDKLAWQKNTSARRALV